MPKIIIVFFVLAIGMVVWALQPAPEKKLERTTTEAQAPVATSSNSDNPPIKRRIATDRVKKASAQKTDRAHATAIPRRPHDELVRERTEFQKMSEADRAHRSAVPPGAKVNRPWPVALPGEQIDYDKNPAPKYQRPKSESPFPAVATTAFKDSVRRYYGGLPAAGRAGIRIMAADVLPNAIITGLKVPPNSELKMLGPFNMDHDKVFQNALATPDYGEVVFGVSYETPSGEQHRKYIRLEGETVE